MKRFFAIILINCILVNIPCFGLRLIRDAEIEETLTEMARDIFKVAGLKEKSAKVFVINSDEINAFTIGNGYIFVNSGLLLKISDFKQMLGILAHETAHIAAGHINRLMSVISNRTNNMTMAMIAGVLGTIATGSEAGLAAILGYSMADDRLFLRYSRGEEFAADALAAKYLNKMGYTSAPMIQVFQIFRDMEILNGGEHIPTYIKSHPNPQERINALKRFNDSTKISDSISINRAQKYGRIILKLKAYIKDHNNAKDEYSKAIWLHRSGNVKEAIVILKNLVARYPGDIFYKETLAQCLYESGNLKEAVKIYEQIYKTHKSHLINIDYARALIESNQQLDKAIQILETEKYTDSLNDDIYRLLSGAYGKKNKIGISHLMLAQEHALLGHYREALILLNSCLKKLNKVSEKSYIKKAEYLKSLIERNLPS